MTDLLEVNNINCRYDNKVIIESLSFSVRKGEIVSLLGPSGCGKTTALRAIAGFEPIYHGDIKLNGNLLSSPESTIAPEKRGVGMVFQDYALFPHLTVEKNIAFGLHQLDSAARAAAVKESLSLVRLEGYDKQYPHQLSGGQQQRVALARALAPRPPLLLMDEPFSNLDTEMRRSLSIEVREILLKSKVSAILVTHDQQEAFTVADKTGVMNHGQLQQWDTPENLLQQPASDFVRNFIRQ